MDNQFPVGGSREAVHSALSERGFVMGSFSDKHWTRADGLHAHVYGTGSRLRIMTDAGKEEIFDGLMADALAFIDTRK